jgi:Sulfite exporter TauE/SafE
MPPGICLRTRFGSSSAGALLAFGLELLRPRRGAAPEPRERPNIRAAVLAGAAIGAIGGLIGLILGTLRMPALLRWVGEAPARAVGTNLVWASVWVRRAFLDICRAVSTGRCFGWVRPPPFRVRLSARATPAACRRRTVLRAIGVILVLSGTVTVIRGVL